MNLKATDAHRHPQMQSCRHRKTELKKKSFYYFPERKRPKKKVLQAVIPLLFGMKSTGAILFAMALVTAITMKAFFASKLALLVTIGMAMKKLYESYSNG